MTSLLTRQVPARQCGECTACCTILGIVELKKAAYVPCAHLTRGGCGVYPDRPPTCRRYLCAWRNGLGDDGHRPDRLGVLFTPFDMKEGVSAHTKSQGMIAHEVRDGAFQGRAAVRLMKLIVVNDWPIFLIKQGQREQMLATAEMLRDIDAYCAREGYTNRAGILVEADRDDAFVRGVPKRPRHT